MSQCVSIMERFIHFLVPPPDVTVTATYTAPLYAGSSFTLTCIVTLDPNVDNDETVTASWSGPSDIIGDRYIVTETMGSGSSYFNSLTINLLTNSDDGIYTCSVLIKGQNIQQIMASGIYNIPTIRKPKNRRIMLLCINY